MLGPCLLECWLTCAGAIDRSLASACFPGVEGGLGAAVDVPSASVDVPSGSVDMPSASVDMPSGSVDVPSVDLSGKGPDMPSVGGEISGDLPSVDAKLTGPDVDVEGGGASLGAGLAAGVTAAVGAAAVGLGLSGKADKPEGEVRVLVCVCLVRTPFWGPQVQWANCNMYA